MRVKSRHATLPARPTLGPLFVAAATAWAAIFACEQLMWWHYVGAVYAPPAMILAGVTAAGTALLVFFCLRRKAKSARSKRAVGALAGHTPAAAILIVVAVCTACICACLYWAAWESDTHAVQEAFSSGPQLVELTSDVAQRDYGQVSTGLVHVGGHEVALRILWTEDAETLPAGHAVQVTGSLKLPEDDAGGRWNHQNGYVGMVSAQSVASAGYASGLRGLVTPFRDATFSRIEQLGGDAAGLLAGVLLGNNTLYSGTQLEQAFRTTGLAHLMAVSGSHLAVVCVLISWVFALTPLGRRSRFVAIAAVLVCYVAFTCFAPSALRSCVMCLAGLAAGIVRRRRHTVGALALTTLVFVLISPNIAFSVSYQLSALAVLGLILYANLLGVWVAQLLPSRANALAEPIGATLAATLPTLPVTVPLFAQLPLVNPAATLVASPLFSVIISLGLFAAVLAACIEPAGVFLLQACGAVAQFTASVVEFFASLPAACVPLEGNAGVLGVACAAFLAAIWAAWPLPAGTCKTKRPRHRLCRVGALTLLFAIPVAALLVYGLGGLAGAVGGMVPATESPAQLVMLDVGQGDSFLIRDGTAAVLIDTGEDATVLKRELADLGVTALDAVVITHKDADHCGALAELAGVVRIEHVYVHADLLSSSCMASVLEAASWVTFGREAEGLRVGSQLAIGAFTLTLVAPQQGGESENDDSLVTLLEYDPEDDGIANARGLFSGDAEAEALETVARTIGDLDFVKVPHHGSAGAFSAAELAALRPEFALCSVGADNSYGHPAASTLDLLEQYGVKVYRSDQQGAVTVNFAPHELSVTCEK